MHDQAIVDIATKRFKAGTTYNKLKENERALITYDKL
jgi:hypothetical protein